MSTYLGRAPRGRACRRFHLLSFQVEPRGGGSPIWRAACGRRVAALRIKLENLQEADAGRLSSRICRRCLRATRTY